MLIASSTTNVMENIRQGIIIDWTSTTQFFASNDLKDLLNWFNQLELLIGSFIIFIMIIILIIIIFK